MTSGVNCHIEMKLLTVHVGLRVCCMYVKKTEKKSEKNVVSFPRTVVILMHFIVLLVR